MSPASPQGRTGMTTTLGSMLVASPDPDALRAWYVRVLGAEVNADGFVIVGGLGILFDRRDDVAARNPEPGRIILNFHVDDIQAGFAALRDAGATIELEPEWRGQIWFATALDPDGNRIQLLELSDDYFVSRGLPVTRS